MTTPNTTATAGAVRAAEAICAERTGYYDAWERGHIAAIIDRETGAAELIAALEAMVGWVSEDECGRVATMLIGNARAAIAKARGAA